MAHDGYLWHCSQTVGNFCVFAVCVEGLSVRWQAEQFAVNVEWFTVTVAQTGYLWQTEQVFE